MKFPHVKLLPLCLFIVWAYGVASIGQAQITYCPENRILGKIPSLAWSPDGALLAVTTLQGVHFYDRDLNLVRSIEAPILELDITAFTGPVWSPDSTWIILPQHTNPETVVRTRSEGGWSIANAHTGELRGMQSPGIDILELVWSPANKYILALTHESPFGLRYPYSQLKLVLGINDFGFSPRKRVYEDLHLHDIRWDTNDTITARSDGLTVRFDSWTLEPLEEPPVFHASWWVPSPDGSREAAAKPDITFVVREVGGEEQQVSLSVYTNTEDEFIMLGIVDEIVWLPDNERLLGIFYSPNHTDDAYPELPTLLQGTIVDARNALELDKFLLQADGAIQGYAVSSQGDRIALYRDDTWVELWNPLTQDRLAMVNIPSLPLEELCEK